MRDGDHGLTDIELSYIAGFFDGEGSVTIHENWRPSPRGRAPNHTLQVSIGNTNPIVLNWIKEVFGGIITVRPAHDNHREVTQWSLRAASALPFLEAIFPFLKMKIEQAKIAINYQRTKRRTAGGPGKFVPLEEIAWREEQRRNIRALNRRGIYEVS